jgi:hypothetical protein
MLHRMINTTTTHQQPPPPRSAHGVQPLRPMGGIQSTIDRFMRKADKNASGRISWLKFREAVEDWRNEIGALLEVRIEGFEAFQCDYNLSGAHVVRLTPSEKTKRNHHHPHPIVEVVVDYGVSEVLGSMTMEDELRRSLPVLCATIDGLVQNLSKEMKEQSSVMKKDFNDYFQKKNLKHEIILFDKLSIGYYRAAWD